MSGIDPIYNQQTSHSRQPSLARTCLRCRCFPLSVRALLPLFFALTFWTLTMVGGLLFGNALYDQRLSEKPFKDSGFKWSFDWKNYLGPENPRLYVCAAGSPESQFDMVLSSPHNVDVSPLERMARDFSWRKGRANFSDAELDHIALLANEGVAYADNTRDVYPFPFQINNYYAAAHFAVLLTFVMLQGRRSPVVLKRLLLMLAASQILFHAQLTVTQFPDPLLPCLPFGDDAISATTLSVSRHSNGSITTGIVTTGSGGSAEVVTPDDSETTTTTTTTAPPPLLGGSEDVSDGYTWRLDGPRQWSYNNQAAQYVIGAFFVQFYCTSWVIRIMSWVVSVVGIFLLVPTHYMYTVDVMTGVLSAVAVFLMYHWSVRTTLSIEKRSWVRWLEYDHICLQRYGRLLLCGASDSTQQEGQGDPLLHRGGASPPNSINRYSAPVTTGEANILRGDVGTGGGGGKAKRGSSGNQSMSVISPTAPIRELVNRRGGRREEEDGEDSNGDHDDTRNSLSSNDIVAEAVVEAGAITHHKATEDARISNLESGGGAKSGSSLNNNSVNGQKKRSDVSNGGNNAGDEGHSAADFAPPSAYGKIQRAAIIQHEENVKSIQQRRPANININTTTTNDLYNTGNSTDFGGATINMPPPPNAVNGSGIGAIGYYDGNGYFQESVEMASTDYALEHFRVPTLTLVDKARFLTLILDEVEHEYYSVFSPHAKGAKNSATTEDAGSSSPAPALIGDEATSAVVDDSAMKGGRRAGSGIASPASTKNSVLGSRQSEGYFSCASGVASNAGGGPATSSLVSSSRGGGGSRQSSVKSMPEEDSDEDSAYFRQRNPSGGPVQHVLGTAGDRPRSEDSSPLGPPLTSFTVKEGKETIRIRTDSVRYSTATEGIINPVEDASAPPNDDEQERILYNLWIRRWVIVVGFCVGATAIAGVFAFGNIISIDVADTNRPIGIPLPPDVIFHFLPSVPPHTPDFLLYSEAVCVLLYMALSRYRFVMVRRSACIYGICMLGRCLTVPATFPIDPSLLCKTREHADGVTCGDLIYSGHTITFITAVAVVLKYVRPLWVRAGVSAYTFCGLLAVITSRLHYTRDVLTAVLVTGTVYYVLHRILFHRYDLFLHYPRLRWLELDYFTILVEDRALAQQGKTRRHLWIKGSVGETFGAIADAWEKRRRRQERERRRREGEV